MRPYMIIFSGLFLAAAPAFAQENVIKIIQDDGTVAVVKIAPPEQPKEEEPPSPEQVRSGLENSPPPAPQVAPVPEPTMDDVIRDVTETAPPVKAEEAKPAFGPAPKEKSKPKSKPKSKTKKPAKKPAKSAVPDTGPAGTMAPSPVVIPPGQPITRDMAVSIALEHAPAVSGIDAFPRTLDGRLIYVVLFKTEDGDREVLVDATTGEIIPPPSLRSNVPPPTPVH